jgi:broad specificity phosphatase PhoE
MPSFSKKKFYFIRHGETDFNKEKRYTGLFDISLNKKGIEQVKQSLFLLDDKNISIIYSSPLKRALQTAGIISQYLDIPIVIIKNFKERNFGVLQTKKKSSYKKKYFYKGQTLYEHQRDTIRGYKKIHTNNFLIVAHSGTYKALKKYLLDNIDISKTVKNASPIFFYKNEENVWKIKKLNYNKLNFRTNQIQNNTINPLESRYKNTISHQPLQYL